VYALEGCQRGFAAWREASWSDISRGMGRAQPSSQDELQMRTFWRRWHALMHGVRGLTDCSDRVEQREAAEEDGSQWQRSRAPKSKNFSCTRRHSSTNGG